MLCIVTVHAKGFKVAGIQGYCRVKQVFGGQIFGRQLIALDVWDSYTDFVEVDIDPECPVCGKHHYTLLEHRQKNYTASLCGHDAYQVTPEDDGTFDYDAVVERLGGMGEVKRNRFFTIFKNDKADFKLFPDGRAIINGVADGDTAQKIFAEYIDR